MFCVVTDSQVEFSHFMKTLNSIYWINEMCVPVVEWASFVVVNYKGQCNKKYERSAICLLFAVNVVGMAALDQQLWHDHHLAAREWYSRNSTHRSRGCIIPGPRCASITCNEHTSGHVQNLQFIWLHIQWSWHQPERWTNESQLKLQYVQSQSQVITWSSALSSCLVTEFHCCQPNFRSACRLNQTSHATPVANLSTLSKIQHGAKYA
jgi:hypothetical protein